MIPIIILCAAASMAWALYRLARRRYYMALERAYRTGFRDGYDSANSGYSWQEADDGIELGSTLLHGRLFEAQWLLTYSGVYPL